MLDFRNFLSNKKNYQQNNKQRSAGLMYDCNGGNFGVHYNNTGNQSDAVKGSHQNFQSGLLPALFGGGGVSGQNQNTYYRNGNGY